MKRILPFLLIAALMVAVTSVLASPELRPEPVEGPSRRAQTSNSFDQSWHVLAGAGAPSSSESFAVNGSMTQFAIDVSDSDNYRAESGYWYGMAPFIAHLPVGGLIVPVSKQGLLAPWASVALLVVAAGGALLIWKRRGSGSPG